MEEPRGSLIHWGAAGLVKEGAPSLPAAARASFTNAPRGARPTGTNPKTPCAPQHGSFP